MRAALLVLGLLLGLAAAVLADDAASPWWTAGPDGKPRVQLYFFWSKACPHCTEARPLVDSLAAEYSWLELHSLELTEHPEHAARYRALATGFGEEARSVPAFFFCANMLVGYGGPDTTGDFLRQQLSACHARLLAGAELSPPKVAQATPLLLPWLGQVDPQRASLPLFTLMIAGLDAFNPCAFFVLLFLLSLLVHARSRARMLLIGGTFVFCSGLVYFLFMAAWLNLFLLLGEFQAVTLAAGLVAVGVALLNIKDFLWLRRGPSLSIPERAKPGLFQRMRGLLGTARTPALILGTLTLALAANAYELLCTAGFPMVYTRVLTLRGLGTGAYYLYLLLYNLIYVVPLLLILLAFTYTLGARKLQEHEGRSLKLLSGLMMLGLGGTLLLRPEALNRPLTAVLLLLGASAATGLAAWWVRRVGRREDDTVPRG
jgi:hypothetical protein